VFDGAMIVLAMFTLNVFHPGLLLVEPMPQQADDIPAVENKVEDINESNTFSPDTPQFKPVMAINQYGTGPYGAFSPRTTKKFEEPLEE